MFGNLVEAGRALVARLEQYRHTDISDIPIEQRMASSEVDAWFDAAATIIEETFGKDSKQWAKWHQAHQKLDMAEDKIAYDQRNSAVLTIRRIHTSMGLLSEFQIYRE